VDEFSMQLPEGIKIENGQFTGAFSGQFPIDQTRQPLVQSVKLVGQFTGKRPSDEKTPAIDLKGVLLRSVTREMQKAN